jgi:hypothetical protein
MKLKEYIEIQDFIEDTNKLITYFKIDTSKPKEVVERELMKKLYFDKNKSLSPHINIHNKKFRYYKDILEAPYVNWIKFNSQMSSYKEEEISKHLDEILECYIKDCNIETIREMDLSDAISLATFFLSRGVIFLKNIKIQSLNQMQKMIME